MVNQAGRQLAIGSGQTMNVDAARHAIVLREVVAAMCGVWVVWTEGTRTYARQKELYDGYRLGRIDPATGRRYNPAWPPDSPHANHLAGNAVDVGSQVGYVDTRTSKTFYSVAGAYGFRPTVQGEPWHFEFRLAWVRPDIRAQVAARFADHTDPASTIPPTIIRTDDDEMLSPEAQAWLRDLRDSINDNTNTNAGSVKEGVRRDARYRLYRNAETGRYVAVNWDLPSADPARAIYPNDEAHLARMYDPYQLIADTAAQAKVLAPFEWDSLHRLINGTDVAYREDKTPPAQS